MFNNINVSIALVCWPAEGSERLRGAFSVVLIFVFLFAHTCEGMAAVPCEPPVGEAVSVQGLVEFNRVGQLAWETVTQGEPFCAGDSVRTASRSRAAILIANQILIRLDEDTSVTFTEIRAAEPSWLDLLKGGIHFLSRTRRSLKVKTPFVNAAIEGTEFVVRVTPLESGLWVYEGVVVFENAQGSLTLRSGEAAVAVESKTPARRIVIDPLEAVQWALYYPPVIDYRAAAQATGLGRPAIEEALVAYRRNDLDAAFAHLDVVPEVRRSATYYTLRAGLLLSVGRVDQAQPDIDRALVLDPANGTAYALRAIIALVRNETDKALSLAEQGARLDSRSSTPQVALSYAHQAQFDIQQARDDASQAVSLSPQDALAWARLSELELSLGELDKALAAARQAASLDPDIARTQTILGFANLTEIKIDEAKNAFKKAIALDQAAPLPRLGLSLATIRAGDLDDGVSELEIAASLDPKNSLIRSYLGKGYYDQKREKLAATEFEMAKGLDPKDPTPYFYDAILKQTTNRPVEALRDLQKSIELNDNRAVYRSRLLLDGDLAARSASLGRIYNDLGFQQLGLLEGWKSVNIDPSNYSAHRLLADNYAALPRHEIARVSELLQSQLLQPINITPVQPTLADSNLLILEGAGPSDLSFNEFNPLFVRNRLALQASGVVGSNGTLGDEVTQSGLWNKFSYSLGQFHFETDGFRDNNDLDVNIYNAYIQAKISPKFNAQVEYRYRDIETGDLESFFSPTEADLLYQQNHREKSDSDIYRLGLYASPSQRSDLLASFIHLDEDGTTIISPDGPATSAKTDGYLAETQYLYRRAVFNIIFGGGYYRVNQAIETGDFRTSVATNHSNAYLYSRIQLPSSVGWTLGLSGDSFSTDSISNFSTDSISTKRNRINPKFGILWNITRDSVFRAAFLTVLKRSVFVNQTLEPTQVAGFNQFFDDPTGSRSQRWGAGIDHRFNPDFTGGFEISKRDLKIPVVVPAGTELRWREFNYRAYLQFSPHPSWATEIEYSREDFDNAESKGPLDTETQIIPFSVSYFDPSGLFTEIRTSYLYQKVGLERGNETDSATILDLSFGYRLPRRSGIFETQLQNILDQNYRYEGLQSRRPQERTGLPSFLPFPPEFTVSARLTLSF